jgi:hypothetical protein
MKKITTILAVQIQLLVTCVAVIVGTGFMSGCRVEGLPPIQAVEGPPILFGTTFFDLAKLGYQQREYFISGNANSYTSAAPLQTDGKWSVQEADSAAFKTRIVVYSPIDSTKFNGTVIFEWLNVSGGAEAGTDWIGAHTELMANGYTWIGVSAQKGGIDGGGINYAGLKLPLKVLNPVRYESLLHPGDKYAYDIFSQVAQITLNPPADIKPLEGLGVERVIASGESQSADFLMTYINAIATERKLFDGYFVHSRLHGSAGLDPQTTGSYIDFSSRSPVYVRDDLNVPVMMVQAESDLFVLGSYADRQADSANFRLWEIAGTGHADTYISSTGLFDQGADLGVVSIVTSTYAVPVLVNCDKPINSGPQHFVVKAALVALDKWIRDGVAPANAPRLQTAGMPAAIVRDGVGNALGGIRTPAVDAPIATLSGEGQTGGVFCGLFGTTEKFSKAQLAGLYADHETYVSAVSVSVDEAVSGGFLLQGDGDLINAWARSSTIGK